MRRRLLAVGVVALAALTTLTGCGGSSTETAGGSPAATSQSGAAQPHNQQDVMFAQHMIPHHQQAIEMSDIVLSKTGIDPRVVNLANQIKAAQGPEIQQMQSWLNEWGTPTMPMTPSGSMTPSHNMPGHDMGDTPGMGNMPGMTGMMSEQDMTALRNAQGAEAGKLYLTQMITHHQGAITMAQDEIKSGQYPPAVALAQSIVTAQQNEIDEMNGILPTL